MSSELEEMSIMDHLDELRKRIVFSIIFITIGSIIAYMKADLIITILKEPLGNIALVFITPIEGFITKLMVALCGGTILAFPLIFIQTILFISPAMYKREKIIAFLSLPIVVGLFLGGIYFCYIFILPTTLKYLMSFGTEDIQPMLSVSKYFSFVLILTISIGAIFELPMVMLLLTKLGIISYPKLAKKRKYALLVIVVVTALLTPTPDAVTLIAVALPLVLLFEISLGVMYIHHKIFDRKKNKADEDYEENI